MQTQSTVVTQHGQVYMKKLCRHWGHRVKVELNEKDALIQLPFGPCRIEVDSDSMRFDVDVERPAMVEKAEKFVASHLVRMANRDKPEMSWQREDPSQSSFVTKT